MKKLLYEDSAIRLESDGDAITLKHKFSSITVHCHEIQTISTRGPIGFSPTPILDTVDIHLHNAPKMSIVISTPDGDAERLMQAIEHFRSLSS